VTAVELVIRTIYGRILSMSGPIPADLMDPDELAALLQPHELDIAADAEAICELVEAARRDGAARVYTRFRKAEGLDPEMVDQVMESDDLTEHEAFAEEHLADGGVALRLTAAG